MCLFHSLYRQLLRFRFGRKPTLLVLMFIKLVGIALSTFCPNYATLAVGRFLLGLGSMGCYNTCYVLSKYSSYIMLVNVGHVCASRVTHCSTLLRIICFLRRSQVVTSGRFILVLLDLVC